jgi:Bacterial PH domain
MQTYKAPWSPSLAVMSSLISLVCVGTTIVIMWSDHGLARWAAVLPLMIISAGALFTVRGYTVAQDAIMVHRLFWTTSLPLTGLQSAQFQPNALQKSIRTFGNGGLFSFSGWFHSKALGGYRAFVTDPRRTVVLHFARRVVSVSPSAPEDFIHDITAMTHAV